jgi:hypothetical protein
MQRQIVIRDAWGSAVAHCTGPAAGGACPRVAVGEVVFCAGRTVEPDRAGHPVAYRVAEGELTCPVTEALALAATSDTARVA